MHEHEQSGILTQPVTLSAAHKIIATIGAVVVAAVTFFGGRALTEYRVSATDKRVELLDARVVQLERGGNPEHERRITRVEARADSTDKDVATINAKLDVAVAILQRMEKQLDNQRK